jgi:hypothetical protein
MKTQKISVTKKRGRPRSAPTGVIRLPESVLEDAEEWGASLKPPLTRPEAIRRLVELGLKNSQPKKTARTERTWLGRRRVEERETMTQDEARRLVLTDWRALPKEKRESNTDRLLFAMKAADKYLFKCSGEPYQTVMSWLERETPGKGRR